MGKKGRAFSVKLIAIVLIFLVGISSLYFMYRRAHAYQIERLEQLEDRVQKMDQLVTARQTYREVIYSERKLLLADKRVLFSLIFTVEAGVRLDNCRVEKTPGGGVLVYLPPVEILSIDGDELSIKQYFAKEQLTPLRFSDFSSVMEEEKALILTEARESGLVSRAETNAVNTIKGIFRMAQIDRVTVRFSESLGLSHRGEY